VDSRYVNVLQVGIEAFRHVVLRALEKHQKVIVRFVSGNHDPHAVWALAFTIAAYFDNEPRVEVDLSPAKHWFYRFGKVLIGATHGDTTKPEQLLGVMAVDQSVNWGLTVHRYFYCGHVHHSSVKEYPGVTVETFRTLAAADAYAKGHGYRAGRDMRAIILHRDHGEIERHRCDVGMLEVV
jgi:UDP-2,3-diacylglucosamine pyrophosphatase LpxH